MVSTLTFDKLLQIMLRPKKRKKKLRGLRTLGNLTGVQTLVPVKVSGHLVSGFILSQREER